MRKIEEVILIFNFAVGDNIPDAPILAFYIIPELLVDPDERFKVKLVGAEMDVRVKNLILVHTLLLIVVNFEVVFKLFY